MFVSQIFKNCLPSGLESVTLSSLRHSFQDWIRKQIVDDDPDDVETLFPIVNRFDHWELMCVHIKSVDANYN